MYAYEEEGPVKVLCILNVALYIMQKLVDTHPLFLCLICIIKYVCSQQACAL